MKVPIPFTSYDFYAYFVSGAGVLLAINYAFFRPWYEISTTDWRWAILLGTFAYILGELIASLSGLIFEVLIIKLFTEPCEEMLRRSDRWAFFKELAFGRYYKPLSKPVRKSIFHKIKIYYPQVNARQAKDVFQLAYARVRQNSDTAIRLDDSRNQYAFARNISMAALLSALIIGCGPHPKTLETHWLIGLCSFIAIGMWLRFMKFYSTFYSQTLRAFLAEPNNPQPATIQAVTLRSEMEFNAPIEG